MSKTSRIPLVKYGCGCVGLHPVGGQSLIFWQCDHDGEPYGVFVRDNMADKGYSSVSPERAGEILGEIDSLVSKGYMLDAVRGMLK